MPSSHGCLLTTDVPSQMSSSFLHMRRFLIPERERGTRKRTRLLGSRGVPFVNGPKRTENAALTSPRLGTRSGTGFAPGVARGSSVFVSFGVPVLLLSCALAFLCSCFPEGLPEGLRGPAGERRSPPPRGSVNRWGNRRRPAPQDPSRSLSKGRPTAPCEGETLFPEVANYTGPCVSPLTGENKRGLAAPGVCDSPIG